VGDRARFPNIHQTLELFVRCAVNNVAQTRGVASLTLEKYLKDLADDTKPLKHLGLLQLSSLPTEDVIEFKTVWVGLPKARKREIIGKLVELCEDNIELDFNAIFRACLNDEDEEVREYATRGLWESDDRAVIRPLIALLKDDRSPRVRAAAAVSLGKFAEMAQDGKLLPRDGERIRDALLCAIRKQDEDVEVRRRSIEAIACFSSPETQQIIRDAYNNSDMKLKQSAIFAMGRSSDTQWLPIILAEMNHRDAAIRYEAANAAGQLGDESTVPHLIKLIKDDDPQVQLSAVHAMGAIGGPLAKRALLQCLKAGDEALEEAAQAALSNIEYDEDPLGYRFQA
jgi:HEAT repeat protein